ATASPSPGRREAARRCRPLRLLVVQLPAGKHRTAGAQVTRGSPNKRILCPISGLEGQNSLEHSLTCKVPTGSREFAVLRPGGDQRLGKAVVEDSGRSGEQGPLTGRILMLY